jgi:hypothetical protein
MCPSINTFPEVKCDGIQEHRGRVTKKCSFVKSFYDDQGRKCSVLYSQHRKQYIACREVKCEFTRGVVFEELEYDDFKWEDYYHMAQRILNWYAIEHGWEIAE